MEPRNQRVGGVDPARGSSGRQQPDAPVERARSGRPADAMPTDPGLSEDLGAEFEFRGDQLEDELESARREAAAHLDTAQRLQAEFDNFRRRMAQESEIAGKRTGERLVRELLPALDNLERAIAHAEGSTGGTELIEGVRMVLQQILDVFGKEGVEAIDPAGLPFDPNEHQSVGQVERDDVPDGTVTEVYQRGYRMNGRVLRPAMVVISTGGPAHGE